MIRWIPYTFVRTVLFFAGGILLGFYAPDLLPEKLLVILVALITTLYFLVVLLARRGRRMLNPGWVALPLIFLLGYTHLIRQTASRDPLHLLHTAGEISHYQAMITRFPEEKARSWRMEAALMQVHTDTWRRVNGKIVLYFAKEDYPTPFQYGDVVVVQGSPQVPEEPGNPGEFDYREFLALKNIYHQDFLRKGDAVKVAHDPPYWFMAIAFQGRQWAEETLHRFVEGNRQQRIASALVLGITDGLDPDLLGAYAATGSMHILAVSGLHISILYFLLLWILSPLNRFGKAPWLVAVAALAILWLYAFVTGLSPSVLRAVGMFSFFALAKPWARSTNTYNTLAASAFCLMLYDPFLIRSVGFQLSYLAVLGIVFLYPRIVVLWEPPYRFLAEVWKLAAVSVAAQIATFPLGLLYFHQFPNYFLLSNLFVVPLSFVILILGLLLLAVSFIPMLGVAAGYCLGLIIRLQNTIVFALEDLPFSLIDNVHISAWQCMLLFALILTAIALLQYRKFRYVIAGFLVSLSFVSLQWVHFAREVNVRKVAVYRIPGHSALDLIDRGQAFFLADPALESDRQKIRFHIQPHRIIAGVAHIRPGAPVVSPLKGGRLILWNGLTILQVDSANLELPGHVVVDWLVVGNNAVAGVASLRERVSFDKVVLDSSNSFFFASRFLEEAKLYKLDVHSVLHHGAFVSKIENLDS